MITPLVEMDGDEMTRILWKMIKDELIYPFIDLKSEYYDLGLEERNRTNDQVTFDSAYATKKYGVAVKCATITPNAARMTEYNLKEMWKSPNGTIRAILDGTVFRAPILVKGIEPNVKSWKKPITIARHAYGDVYKASEMKIPAAGKVELVYTAEDGTESRELIHDFTGAGIVQGQHNIESSIESFAHSCFKYALRMDICRYGHGIDQHTVDTDDHHDEETLEPQSDQPSGIVVSDLSPFSVRQCCKRHRSNGSVQIDLDHSSVENYRDQDRYDLHTHTDEHRFHCQLQQFTEFHCFHRSLQRCDRTGYIQ